MQVQLNTDKNISGTEKLEAFVSEKAKHVLKHFANKITRIEVHLSDQNAEKGGGEDIQCKIESRVEGIQPILVVSRSGDKETALNDALDKMKTALTTRIGKMRNH